MAPNHPLHRAAQASFQPGYVSDDSDDDEDEDAMDIDTEDEEQPEETQEQEEEETQEVPRFAEHPTRDCLLLLLLLEPACAAGNLRLRAAAPAHDRAQQCASTFLLLSVWC